MAKRKFNQYLIQITHCDGTTENIEYSSRLKQVDKSSYNDMLKVYRETKDEYSDVNCTIDFLGINDNEQVIIFKKYNEIEYAENNGDTIFDLADELQQLLNKIFTRKEIVSKSVSEADSAINYIYHADIENTTDESDDHKINTYDKLKQAFELRRAHKNEISMFNSLEGKDVLSKLENCINEIKKSVDTVQNKADNSICKIQKYSNGEISEVKIYDAVHYSYNNFKERINLIQQLQPLFDSVTNDEVNKQLICKGRKNRSKGLDAKVATLVGQKGGVLKYKTYAERDILIELLEEKFNTVINDSVKMKITASNIKKRF